MVSRRSAGHRTKRVCDTRLCSPASWINHTTVTARNYHYLLFLGQAKMRPATTSSQNHHNKQAGFFSALFYHLCLLRALELPIALGGFVATFFRGVFCPALFLSTCIYSLPFSILYIFFWARSRDIFFILTAVSRPVSRPLHPISTCIYSLHFSILYIFRPVRGHTSIIVTPKTSKTSLLVFANATRRVPPKSVRHPYPGPGGVRAQQVYYQRVPI